MKIRSIVAAGSLVAVAATGAAVAASSSPAQASGALYGVSYTHKVMVSSRCYRTTTHTVTYRHWSSTAGAYIAYTGGPHITDSSSVHCHS